MKTIITGAAGFIGSHASDRLLKQGHTVIGIDNLSRPGNLENLQQLSRNGGNQFQFFHGDIRSRTDMDRIVSGNRDAELVIHEAGQVAVTTSVLHPRMDFESNAAGTLNVLEAARLYIPHCTLLYASTNKVYGTLERLAIGEDERRYRYAEAVAGVSESEPVDFHSPYGCSKGSAEQYVRDYYRIFGLKTIVFRQSCIYGTRQYGMEDQGWVAWFTIAALLGRPITIFGDGKQVRDLLWIDDLLDLYELAARRIDISAGHIYNAGGGASNTLSLLELLDLLETSLGKKIACAHSDWRPGDQRVFYADCGKAKRELGWEPQTVPAQGVSSLIDWIRSHRDSIQSIVDRAAKRTLTART